MTTTVPTTTASARARLRSLAKAVCGRRRTPMDRAIDGGFTLIEVLLVLAIVAFVMTLMWGSFSQAVRTKGRIEAAQDRLHTARTALMRISRELEMAFLSNSENLALPQRRTMFIATSRADIDELTFSAFAHERLRADVNEADTSLISYFGERDPDDRNILNLMRRETRRLQADDPKIIPGETYMLCPDVKRLQITYWDFKKKEWRDDWSTLDATGFQYLPTHVKVSLTVLDERGHDFTLSTDARIHVTEKVDYRGAGFHQ